MDEAGIIDPQTHDTTIELIAAHSHSMYRVAVSIVRDHALAEDVVQEAIIRAWRGYPAFRHESPLRPWLLRITHNTAISTLRSMRDEPTDPWLMARSSPAVDDELSGPFFEAFAAALGDLDPLSRAVVVLRELEDQPYEAIAAILGVPLPTVKTRLFRSRRKLAATMEGWEP